MLFALSLLACNPEPPDPNEQVGYRDGLNGEANSGERGTVKISEVYWSGSVNNEGVWDVSDQFIELRNEGARPMNLSGWRLRIDGTTEYTIVIPKTDFVLEVGEHAFIATKDTGCFLNVTWVVPELKLPYGDPFRVTLVDADERLIEGAGDTHMPPFAGGYDGAVSRSMEKLEVMFGGRGNEPHAWHYYNIAETDVPNNDKVKEECQERTLASPGRANSPDYSGAFAAGSAEG